MRITTKIFIAGVISVLSLGAVPAAQAAPTAHLAPQMVVGCCK